LQIIQKENIKRESLDAIRQMSLNIKHEINNPLTALLGNVELLLDKDCLDSLTRSRLTIIRELSLRIRDVVEKFPETNDTSIMSYSNYKDMIDI